MNEERAERGNAAIQARNNLAGESDCFPADAIDALTDILHAIQQESGQDTAERAIETALMNFQDEVDEERQP